MIKVHFDRAMVSDIYDTPPKDNYPPRVYSQITCKGSTLRVSWIGTTPAQLKEIELEPVTIEAELIGKKIGDRGQLIELHSVVVRRITPK